MMGQVVVIGEGEEPPNPLRGAAYRVLWESFTPFNCTTSERLAEIALGFDGVRSWLETQDQSLRDPYEWSMAQIMAQINQRFTQQTLGDQVNAAFLTIPRPPGGS